MAALLHSKKIMPLLMEEIENDSMCTGSELRKAYANVKVTTLDKPDKQDPQLHRRTCDRLAQASHCTKCRGIRW